MRPGDRAKIGSTRRDDRIDVIGLGNGADGDGVDMRLVADLVGERRLEHAAIDRPLGLRDLTRRAIDEVGAGFLEQFGEECRVLRGVSPRCPVMARETHRHRAVLGPGGAHSPKHLERIARPVEAFSSVLVITPVRERRKKAREEVAVRAVELEPITSSRRRAPGRRDKIVSHPVHIVSRHGLRDPAVRQVGHSRRRDQLPAARLKRMIDAFPSDLGRALAARVAELNAGLRSGAVNEIDQPLPLRLLLVAPKAEAARGDARIRRDAGHLGEDEPRPAQSAGA